MFTQDLLHAYLFYNESDGQFYWKIPPYRSKYKVGELAGARLKDGRIQITLDGNRYYAHQLVYLYNYGYIPEGQIKHKNGNYWDNRIENLYVKDIKNFEISKENLEKLFTYDPTSGNLFTLGRNELVGHVHSRTGYVRVSIDGKTMSAHRLVWTLLTGEILESSTEIDHINGIRHDNRIENLRKATKSQNRQNSKLRKDNTTGIKGLIKYKGRYYCQIRDNNQIYKASFALDELEAAITWLQEARKLLHKEFANTGTQ